MTKIYFLLFALLIGNLAFGQTLIVGQDFDSETGWTYTADPETYNLSDGKDVWGAVATLGSTNNGLDAAQNGTNFWGMRDLDNPWLHNATDDAEAPGLGLVSPYNHTLTFKNVSVKDKTDLIVSFYYNAYSLEDAGYLKVEFFYNNVSQGEEIVFTNVNGKNTDGWVKFEKEIPDGNDSLKMVVHAYNDQDYLALDNVSLVTGGVITPTCDLVIGATDAVCDTVTDGIDTYTATLAYSGAGNEAYTVVSSSGTVGGDDPTSVASGTITVTGIEEGTDVTLTITSTLCSEEKVITAPTCVAEPEGAVLPVTDHFDYAAATNLTDSELWMSSGDGDEVVVVEDNLSYSGLEASTGNSVTFVGDGNEAELVFNPVTAGKVYSSFIFKITDITNWTKGGYFVYLGGFNARLNIQPIGNQFGIGIAKSNSLTSVNWYLDGEDSVKFDLNTEVFVVMNYDVETGVSEVWVNPASTDMESETAPAPHFTLPDGDITEIGKFVIRQDSESETPTIVMDEVRVGTSWADVTPVASTAAEGSDWNFSDAQFLALEGDITETQTVSGLTIHAAADMDVTIGTSNSTIGDMTYTHRLKLNGSGKYDESNVPTGRVLSFDVTGNTLISIALTSANSSSDRMLNIAVVRPDSVIAQLTATGGVKDVQEYTYTGGAATIYVYSDDSGINLYHIKATPIIPSAQDWNFSDEQFVALEGDLTETQTVSGLTIHAAADMDVTIGTSNSTIGDMTYTHRLKLNGSGKYDESNVPTGRVLSFDVTGNTLISIALTSANSSSDRMLNIAVVRPDSVIAQLTATGGVKDVQEYSYIGGPATIYVYSDDSGINLYQITAKSIPTEIKEISNKVVDVNVYPNPANNKVFVGVDEPTRIAIYSVTGNLVKLQMVQSRNESIDISELREGLYIIRSYDSNLFSKKLIVQ